MAKYITVYLVRHGQTAWNAKGIVQGQSATRLNVKGKKQAAKMAKFFKDIPLTAIYCSPLPRALQTARAVLKYHAPSKLIKWPEFMERNGGKFQGLTMKQRKNIMPDIEERWKKEGMNFRPPGGESLKELSNRAIAGFKKMIRKHKQGDTILVVSHGGPLKCLLHKFHGGKPKDFFHRGAVGNCEVTKILWDDSPKRISCVLK
jgi:broad specificity phosphatase PhoE